MSHDALIADFHRKGYAKIPCRLGADEVDRLKRAIDRVFDDPAMHEDHLYGQIVTVKLFETDNLFRDLLVREPMIDIVEQILGDNCHLIANNAVRNAPGKGITNWHVDELVEFPLGEGMDRHDPRLQMPVQRLTVQIMLTDCQTDADGPSQYVPGSHYSGRDPHRGDDPPTFEGNGPESIYCLAGEMYLHNGQTWHRGAPNESDKVRYLLQQTYSQRHIAQRFYPFLNYVMPQHVLDGASERLLRVLGKHAKGAYG